MQFHAEISALNEEGVLERILRVFRHRGYSIHSLHAVCDAERKYVQLAIEGESQRELSQLSLQVGKLCEVSHIIVTPLESVSAVKIEATPHAIYAESRGSLYASSSSSPR